MDFKTAIACTQEGFDSVKALLLKELDELRESKYLSTKTPEELFVMLFSQGLHCNTLFIIGSEETTKLWIQAFVSIAKENNLDPDEIFRKHYEELLNNWSDFNG